MNILITGANGQLGSEFKILEKSFIQLNFFYLDIQDCDLTSSKSFFSFFKNKNFDCIINCAAYTDVEKAEDDFLNAILVNEVAVKNILELCKKKKIKLIHFSTDYVFDGKNNIPYKEFDLTNPIGKYGISKLASEKLICNSNTDSIIIRTSWLYSTFGKNFVKTMINLSKRNKIIKVVSDQIGCPTYANDLAYACLKIITENPIISKNSKIYHYSNMGQTSWYLFAKEIFKIKKINVNLEAVDSSFFKSKVSRPNYSVLDKSLIKNDFNIKIPDWKDSLNKCLKKIV